MTYLTYWQSRQVYYETMSIYVCENGHYNCQARDECIIDTCHLKPVGISERLAARLLVRLSLSY